MSSDKRSIKMAGILAMFVLQAKFWGTPGEPAAQRFPAPIEEPEVTLGPVHVAGRYLE
jgi:hypothetical protein